MTAITGCATKTLSPGIGQKELIITTPSSADSADTIDVSSKTATGGDTLRSIDNVVGWNKTDGEAIAMTVTGDTELTIGGAVSNKVVVIRVIGE